MQRRLGQPLPGRPAQSRFEPELAYGRHFGPAPPDARPAAVVVLLYPHQGQWHVPLTIRPTTMATHAGQISLPGGRIETNESSESAVLRELHEELGVQPDGVRVLGQLSPLYLFNSNYLVEPWVAATSVRPDFVPQADEVAELLEVPLAELIDPEQFKSHRRRSLGIGLWVPHIAWGPHRIWGATSMILGEFAAVLVD